MKLLLILFCALALAAPEQETARTETTVPPVATEPNPWPDRLAARTAAPDVDVARTEITVPKPWTDRMAARTVPSHIEFTVPHREARTVRADVSCVAPC